MIAREMQWRVLLAAGAFAAESRCYTDVHAATISGMPTFQREKVFLPLPYIYRHRQMLPLPQKMTTLSSGVRHMPLRYYYYISTLAAIIRAHAPMQRREDDAG